MKKENEPSSLTKIITAIILVAILSPVLTVAGSIVSLLIIICLLAAVFYIAYMIMLYIKGKKNKHVVTDSFQNTDNSQNEDILFYQNFINKIREDTIPIEPIKETDKQLEEKFATFEFEDTIESFDQNYFKANAIVDTMNNLDAQNIFWEKFFKSIENESTFSQKIKTHAMAAKEYTDLMQALKAQFGFLTSEKTGFTHEVYKSYMHSKPLISDEIPKTGLEFESYCAVLLEKNGYESVEVTKASGDQGIDILATYNGVKYAIQCKLYSKPVGNSAVQQAYSGKTFYNCHIGVVLTNSIFTPSAIELAEKLGVVLWDKYTLESFQQREVINE